MSRFFILFAAAGVLLAGCNEKKSQTEAPRDLQIQQQLPSGHPDIGVTSATSVAGVSWIVPERWSEGSQKPMRVATYTTPAATGDTEGGECGVFYFGSGQGGDVQMNIDRWVNQFENGKPKQSSKEVNGMKVELVQIDGTYLAPGGPMMQSSGKFEKYRLLGAIVAGPEGSVFFKLTGPAKTIAEAESDFNTLVQSLKK